MKQKILIYLCVFSVLLVLFQYVNSKQLLEDKDNRIATFQEKITTYKDSLADLQNENLNLSHFNLERNEDALSYLQIVHQADNSNELYIKEIKEIENL